MNRMLWSSHKLKHFETYYHLSMFCEQMVKAYFFLDREPLHLNISCSYRGNVSIPLKPYHFILVIHTKSCHIMPSSQVLRILPLFSGDLSPFMRPVTKLCLRFDSQHSVCPFLLLSLFYRTYWLLWYLNVRVTEATVQEFLVT